MEMEVAKEEKRWFLGIETMFKKMNEKCMQIAMNMQKIAKDDPRRVVHSLKMALSLTLVSLIYYIRPFYDGFGVSGMWAVLTVVVVFEFSVGATISKGLNRGFATLTAGGLGVGAQHLAVLCGKKGEPIVLGLLVFLLAGVSTFTRFIPGIKRRYDYGVLIFILTFSLVAISGYRVDMILTLAYQRLATILIGGASCLIVSIFVFPVWAGQDLHNLIARNILNLANFLQGFGEEYSKQLTDNNMNSTIISNNKEPFLQSHKTILSSKTNEENLANFARWEPCHGKFRFRHPWKQYLKIGALARQCAYHIEALSGYIESDSKGSMEFRRQIQDSCSKMSMESSKALKAMAQSIKAMAHPKAVDIHLENAKEASKELESILKTTSYGREDLLLLVPDAAIASILVNITDSVDKISEAVHELAKLAKFKPVKPTVSPENILHRGIINPCFDEGDGHVAITIHDHQETKKEGMETKCKDQGCASVASVNTSELPIVACKAS